MEPPTVTGHKNTFWKKNMVKIFTLHSMASSRKLRRQCIQIMSEMAFLEKTQEFSTDRARIACSMFQALIYHSFKIKTNDIFL